jgi:hypothetical protein
MKIRTQPRPVREEIEDLSRTIRAERDRGKARPGDTARFCDHFVGFKSARLAGWGACCATPVCAHLHGDDRCPQTCSCFRRRP